MHNARIYATCCNTRVMQLHAAAQVASGTAPSDSSPCQAPKLWAHQ